MLVEATPEGGGQAKFSSRIENLPGFPAGVTGERLAADMKSQADRMGSEQVYGVTVTGIEYDPATDLKTVSLSDGRSIQTRSVVVAGGVQFKRAEFVGADSPSVVYGDSREVAKRGIGKQVVIAGGSNGAAQAALAAAKTAEHVTLISRKPIDISMSDYQVHALKNNPRVTVMEGSEISSLVGNEMSLSDGRSVKADAVGVFFGGRSKTDWLPSSIRREAKSGKIVTNDALETDMPGVFAVGDMRSGSIGRIGMAIGDGQFATHGIFRYFEKLKQQGRAFVAVRGVGQ
jgi:thioredoxin reductase (NADPH)